MTAEQIHDALTLLPADLVAEADRKRTRRLKRGISWRRYAAMAACFALILYSGWFASRLFASKGATEMAMEAPAEAAVMQEAVSGSGRNELTFDTDAPAAMAAEPEAAPEEEMDENCLCGLPKAPAKEDSEEEGVRSDSALKSSAATGSLYPGMDQPVYAATQLYLGGTACFSGAPKITLSQSRAELEAFRDHTPKQFELDGLMALCEGYDETWFESHDLLILSLPGEPVGDTREITAIYEEEGQWQICIENCLEEAQAEREDQHILIGMEKGLIDSAENILLIFE